MAVSTLRFGALKPSQVTVNAGYWHATLPGEDRIYIVRERQGPLRYVQSTAVFQNGGLYLFKPPGNGVPNLHTWLQEPAATEKRLTSSKPYYEQDLVTDVYQLNPDRITATRIQKDRYTQLGFLIKVGSSQDPENEALDPVEIATDEGDRITLKQPLNVIA